MSIAQLVLENCFAINERLDFVGEGDEGLCESLNENLVSHPMGWMGDLCRICKLPAAVSMQPGGKLLKQSCSESGTGWSERESFSSAARLFKSHPTGSLGGVR